MNEDARMNPEVEDGEAHIARQIVPDDFDRELAIDVLQNVSGQIGVANRIERISETFLGAPYADNPLDGGVNLPEPFRVSMRAFDCVTYIETVLALAFSDTPEQFIDTLRLIRYDQGQVDWFHRNHYMVDWARNNEREKFVRDLSKGEQTLEKTCTLGLIPGLPAKTATFSYFPTSNQAYLRAVAESGDVLLLVSTKETLDVFHAGLIIKRDGKVFLRHASRT